MKCVDLIFLIFNIIIIIVVFVSRISSSRFETPRELATTIWWLDADIPINSSLGVCEIRLN